MAFTDYLINAIFLVVVLRQARERRLDIRSIVAPMALVVFVATHYVHTIPTGGSDMALALALTLVGLSLGVLCGYATHVRVDADGTRFARVGAVAAILLLAGISARLVFVFALEHGAGPAIRDFSIVHHISAAAWPLALVSMALCEVTARLVIVQVRGQQLAPRAPATVTVSSSHA
jgi:ABC-type antimicrobial peptide transport system permease subunit